VARLDKKAEALRTVVQRTGTTKTASKGTRTAAAPVGVGGAVPVQERRTEMRRHHDREVRDEQVIRLWWKEGMTQQGIANMFRISQSTIHRILVEAGLVSETAVWRERRDAAARLFNSGMKATSIARCLDVSAVTVRKWLKAADAAGTTTRPFVTKTKEACVARREAIRTMKANEATSREIAEKEDLSVGCVWRALNDERPQALYGDDWFLAFF
jgi:DNA invertase Pin-like site-specific DNA recombinase